MSFSMIEQDPGIVEANLLLAQLEEALTEMERVVSEDQYAQLARVSAQVEAVVAGLSRLKIGAEGSDSAVEQLRERHHHLATRASGLAAACFWRSLLVSNLLRDLGLDLGIYGRDGLIEPQGVHSVSENA